MWKNLFACKPLSLLHEEMRGENRLRRVLGPVSLTSLGIGCVIGAGIFVVTGYVAKNVTGPSLILSFIVAGLACVFAALCYAEFAALAPVAGSAYTYAYATLGELLAWIIGWDLTLEYTVASAAVAHGWSKYFQNFIAIFGLYLPNTVKETPFNYSAATGFTPSAAGSHCDLMAIIIVVLITVVLVLGIRESTRVNNIMVGVKLLVVAMVIAVGAFYIHPAYWHPFAPYGWSGFSLFGHALWGQVGKEGAPLGMLAGAAMIFFAYIGFDSVSTHAEEARNPQRDVPIAIISSLLICTVLYIAVSAVLTGMVPIGQIDENAPVAAAFASVGLTWARFIIGLGAIVGITSVLLVLMLSQPRVLLAMARDGLLPEKFFGAVHPIFRTPWKATILTGVLVAIMASFLPLGILADLVNIGTLLAFVIVCAAVLIMRRVHPHAERAFRCPAVPLVPILGIVLCVLLMCSLAPGNWLRLIIWLAIGLVIYFTYGRYHSVLARRRAAGKQDVAVLPGEAADVPTTTPQAE